MSFTNEIIETVKKNKVIHDPFPHMNIINFFDENFYLKLLKSLPNKDEYVQINKTDSVSDKYPDERYVFDLNKEIEALSEEPEDNPTKKALKLEVKELSEAAHILMQHFSNTVDDGK